jgi:DNA repair protein RadC
VPSDADKQITKKLKLAGDGLEIKYWTISYCQTNYFSFVDGVF